jgi:hypothetical protein
MPVVPAFQQVEAEGSLEPTSLGPVGQHSGFNNNKKVLDFGAFWILGFRPRDGQLVVANTGYSRHGATFTLLRLCPTALCDRYGNYRHSIE